MIMDSEGAEAQACERIIQSASVIWTVVRASWFNQNYSDGEFLPMILDGVIALFETVLDGRNAYLGDGVQRALGREPTDFADFAHRIAARGTWTDEEEAA